MFDEDYTMEKQLGDGLTSVVFECVNRASSERFAVKVIDKRKFDKDAKTKQLIQNEVEVLRTVQHAYIIPLTAVYESEKRVFIVMPLRKGGTLVDRLSGRPRFTESEAKRLIRPILEAVAYLHDLGIVHRDIKPDNILCGDDIFDVQLGDFGLAKCLPTGIDTTRTPCGTLSYVGTA
jgi:serine/threonine protein kinase